MNRTKTSIMFTEDFMHFIMTRYNCDIDVTMETIESFVDQYAKIQVSDFIINHTTLPFSITPSQYHFISIKTGEIPKNSQARLL